MLGFFLCILVVLALSLGLFRHYHGANLERNVGPLRLLVVSLFFFGCSGFILLPLDVSCASAGVACEAIRFTTNSSLVFVVALVFMLVPVSLFFYDGNPRSTEQHRRMLSESIRNASPFFFMLTFLLLGGTFSDSTHRAEAALLLPLSVVMFFGTCMCSYFTAYGLGAFPVSLILRKPFEETAAGQLQDKLTGEQNEQEELRRGILLKYSPGDGQPFPAPPSDFEMQERLIEDGGQSIDGDQTQDSGTISRDDQAQLADLRRKDSVLRQRARRLQSALGPLDILLRGKRALTLRYALGGLVLCTAATLVLSVWTGLLQQHYCSDHVHELGYLPTIPLPVMQLPHYNGNSSYSSFYNTSGMYNSSEDGGLGGGEHNSFGAVAERAARFKRGAADYVAGSYQSVSNYTNKLSNNWNAATARAAAVGHQVYNSKAAGHAAVAKQVVSGYLNNAAVYLGINNTADGVRLSSSSAAEEAERMRQQHGEEVGGAAVDAEGTEVIQQRVRDPPRNPGGGSTGSWYTGGRSAQYLSPVEDGGEEGEETGPRSVVEGEIEAAFALEKWCASTGSWNVMDGLLVSLADRSPVDDVDGGGSGSSGSSGGSFFAGADALLLLLLCCLLVGCTVGGIADLGIASLLCAPPVMLLLREPLACCHLCIWRVGSILCGLCCDLGRLCLPEAYAPPDREPGV
jgi:hypothetical protein